MIQHLSILALGIAAMSCEPIADVDADGDATPFDDGSVRVRGVLPRADRERLERSHFDTGMLIDGWSVWVPQEGRNDS